MNDIIKIKKSLEDSGLLIDGATETVKHELKLRRISRLYDGIYGCFIESTYDFLIDTTFGFFFDKCCNWQKSHESSKTTRRRISPLTTSPLMMKVLGKRVTGREKGYNKMDYYQ